MTRFQKEISGVLGEFWKKNAKSEAEKAVTEADKNAVIEEDGAIKWKTNNSYLMDDLCEKLEYMGYPFSRKATQEKREAQVNEKLSKYKSNLSEESIHEMAAAFGSGITVVDVITGEKVITA